MIFGAFLSSNGIEVYISFTLAVLEILRRCLWNVLRLENEHLTNCGQFRVTHEVPLPFEDTTMITIEEENVVERKLIILLNI